MVTHHSDPDDLEPIAPEAALRKLDDESFVAFVVALWERRGWTISERRDAGSWYVDVLAHVEWPAERQTLVRLHLPESDKPLSGTVVRHFTRTVQQSAVDQARIVTADTVAESVTRQADEFGVDIVDNADLVALLEQADAADVLAEYVDRPIAAPNTLREQAPERLVELLDRADAVERVDRALSGLLPPNPTAADVASLSFTGFRVALAVTTGLFVLVVATADTVLLFWLLLGAFLAATYGLLLPLMAIDIYLVRRCEATSWTPTWLLLGAFLLVPVMLVAGGGYWYRRCQQTPRGPDGMWRSAGALR